MDQSESQSGSSDNGMGASESAPEQPEAGPPASQPASGEPETQDTASGAGEPQGGHEPAEPDPGPLVELAAEHRRLKDQLLRTAADFDNFRKRSRRDVEDARIRGAEDAIREFLPVVDNLERAIAAGKDAVEAKAILEGVQMVLKLFEDASQRMGLRRIEAVGSAFDPTRHEAIQQLESAEHEPGSIITQVAPGYLFGERLLRAAMVVVARRPSSATPAGSEEEGEQNDSS